MATGRWIFLLSAALTIISAEAGNDGSSNSHAPANGEVALSAGPAAIETPYEPNALQQHADGTLQQDNSPTLRPRTLLLAAVAAALVALCVFVKRHPAFPSARGHGLDRQRPAEDEEDTSRKDTAPYEVSREAWLTS